MTGAAGFGAAGAPGLAATGAPGLAATGAPGLAATGAPGLAATGAPGFIAGATGFVGAAGLGSSGVGVVSSAMVFVSNKIAPADAHFNRSGQKAHHPGIVYAFCLISSTRRISTRSGPRIGTGIAPLSSLLYHDTCRSVCRSICSCSFKMLCSSASGRGGQPVM